MDFFTPLSLRVICQIAVVIRRFLETWNIGTKSVFRCEENVILNETGDFIDYFIYQNFPFTFDIPNIEHSFVEISLDIHQNVYEDFGMQFLLVI